MFGVCGGKCACDAAAFCIMNVNQLLLFNNICASVRLSTSVCVDRHCPFNVRNTHYIYVHSCTRSGTIVQCAGRVPARNAVHRFAVAVTMMTTTTMMQ